MQGSDMDNLKERFSNSWRIIFSFLSLIILFDLVVQLVSGIFTIEHTLITAVAVALLATVIAAAITLLLPVLNFLLKPVVLKTIASVVVVILAYLYSWWILLGLPVVIFPGRFGGESTARGSYSTPTSEHEEDAAVVAKRNTMRTYEIQKANDPNR